MMDNTTTKGARIDGVEYSATLSYGRIAVYVYTGANYRSIGFTAHPGDFDKFDADKPEGWFQTAMALASDRC